MTQVEAKSWSRFFTRYLVIVPELLGATHEFEFDGSPIEIILPSKDELSKHPAESARAEMFSWREVAEGEKIPLRIAIESADVKVKLERKVNVPEQVLHQPPNAYDIVSEEKQRKLNELADYYGSIAERAFEVWVKVLRWKTSKGLIGRPQVIGSQSGWATYLTESTTGHRFWGQRAMLTFASDDAVTVAEWNEVEQTLQNGLSSPVYYDLLFDAEEHLRHEDLQRAAVDGAVACESFLRQRMLQHLPVNLQVGIRDYIDEANINTVLNRFLPLIFDDEEMKVVKGIKSSLHDLFTARNKILHSGRKDDLSLPECQKYLEVTRKLLAIE